MIHDAILRSKSLPPIILPYCNRVLQVPNTVLTGIQELVGAPVGRSVHLAATLGRVQTLSSVEFFFFVSVHSYELLNLSWQAWKLSSHRPFGTTRGQIYYEVSQWSFLENAVSQVFSRSPPNRYVQNDVLYEKSFTAMGEIWFLVVPKDLRTLCRTSGTQHDTCQDVRKELLAKTSEDSLQLHEKWECEWECQWHKTRPAGLFQPIELPTKPFK